MATLGSVSPAFGLIMAVIFLKEEMALRLASLAEMVVRGAFFLYTG
jgi:uncharacterized membrane protein